MRILVTGASGYIGQWALDRLLDCGHEVFAASAQGARGLRARNLLHILPRWDLGASTSPAWPTLSIDAVLHLAAKVHSPKASISEFERVNVSGTEALLEKASAYGARRFVFLSTIGVHGPARFRRVECVRETAPLQPENAYSQSKLRAEKVVADFCAQAGMRFTIVRAPLVYGTGAPGNVRVLEKLLLKRVPIPLPSSGNRRSFIHVANLADFLGTCVEDRSERSETFVVADDEVVSTKQLVEFVARQNDMRAKFVRLPVSLLNFVGIMTGKQRQIEQLAGDLVVSNKKAKELLQWVPPFPSMADVPRSGNTP